MILPSIKRELLRLRATTSKLQCRRVPPSQSQIQAVRNMAATDAAADACLFIRELLNKRYHELIGGDEFDRIAAEEVKNFAANLDVQHIISCCLDQQKEH